MVKLKNTKMSEEQAIIAKYIFKGYTISQIADKMNCATSTVSYKMQSLFERYNSKNKLDFILNIFSHINNSNKEILNEKNNELAKLEVRYEQLKEIVHGIIKHSNNKENYEYWLKEAKKHF